METPLTAEYEMVVLPEQPAPADLARIVGPYQAMIVRQFQTIVERAEASATYPWLDTKIDLNTGRDYPPGDPLFGRDLVSGWVQGRGLEAVVGFARWLESWAGDEAVDTLILRCRRLAGALLERLRTARALNGGHSYFYMSPEGRAFVFDADGQREYVPLTPESPYNFSDLFTAKGMYAASRYLDDAGALEAARAYCLAVCQDILHLRFTSDQPQPKVVAKAWVPGAFSHGPFMIAQGMAALFAEHEPGPESAEMGLALARRMVEGHINLGNRWGALGPLRDLDMVEYIDAEGQPYVDEGKIISDPGHSLEGAGLFLKLWAAVRGAGALAGAATPDQERQYRAYAGLMPAFLVRNFDNGFRPDVGGIVKTIDLLTRQPIDDTMPWWSLPETVRAGLACWREAGDEADQQRCLAIAAASHNAFVEHYVRPETYLMAVKVRDARGHVLDVVPAYPDADPGYHTALSLIDALKVIEETDRQS